MKNEATQEWLDEPGRLNAIVAHVANGGNLTELCRHNKLDYATVILWLNREPGMKLAYDNALKERNQFLIQRLIEQLAKIATADVSEGLQRRQDAEAAEGDPRGRESSHHLRHHRRAVGGEGGGPESASVSPTM